VTYVTGNITMLKASFCVCVFVISVGSTTVLRVHTRSEETARVSLRYQIISKLLCNCQKNIKISQDITGFFPTGIIFINKIPLRSSGSGTGSTRPREYN
jgi:hypothetical protein